MLLDQAVVYLPVVVRVVSSVGVRVLVEGELLVLPMSAVVTAVMLVVDMSVLGRAVVVSARTVMKFGARICYGCLAKGCLGHQS